MSARSPSTPVHPSITEAQISRLVDGFYDAIRADEKLGPVFETHMLIDWAPHLEKMKGFWRSVLLRTREYEGRPVPAHSKIDGLGEIEFDHWLRLFAKVANKELEPEAAARTCLMAGRIATSLWLSCHRNPMASPPIWNSAIPQDLEC